MKHLQSPVSSCPAPGLLPARRRLLLGGASAAAAVMAAASVGVAAVWTRPAWAQRGNPLVPTPSQSEGPFYPVALPADHDADLLRAGTLNYAQGQPAWVEGTLRDVDGVPVSGAEVQIWQCDAQGHYHHPGDGARADPAFQGFGRAVVGQDGRYRFRTIRPAPYSGRTPHIHFKVVLGRHHLLTTQMYVEGDPGNERDFLWRRLNAEGRRALTVPFQRVPSASSIPEWRAEFPLVVVA
ncbi:MAG: protocatechuate 3,4-dioxygenase [Serpentinimonas sp.]|nr:protocatechuate 3,4-dioxygenase [Serpentinimonas sp.]